MVNDPVGDLIIQIKNAGAIGKELVVVPFSNLKYAVALKLKDKGFVTNAVKGKDGKTLEISLAYDGINHKIRNVKRISKPGRRLYRKSDEVHSVKNGFGSLILSTPKGVLADDEARKAHVGGEALFEIW